MIQGHRIDTARTDVLTGDVRHCPGCGLMRPAKEFRAHRGGITNPFCQFCWRFNRGKVFPLSGGWCEQQRRRRATYLLLLALARKRFEERGDINGMTPEEYAAKAVKLLDRIALIVGKTYAEQGDAASLEDDTALMMIRDDLNAWDDTIIERNKNKRLKR